MDPSFEVCFNIIIFVLSLVKIIFIMEYILLIDGFELYYIISLSSESVILRFLKIFPLTTRVAGGRSRCANGQSMSGCSHPLRACLSGIEHDFSQMGGNDLKYPQNKHIHVIFGMFVSKIVSFSPVRTRTNAHSC